MPLVHSEQVLSTAIQFGQQLETSLQDGFQPIQDIISFIPVLTEIPQLIKDKDLTIAELTPFDEAKATEIDAYVKANLVLKNKKVENVIKGAFSIGLAVFSLYVILKPATPPTPPPVA